MATIKLHHYTISQHSHQYLIRLLCPPAPTRQSVWRNQPIPTYNGSGVTYHTDTSSTYREGLSKTLISLSRLYDYSDWRPYPDPDASPYLPPQNAWYDAPDLVYIQELLEDDDPTPWDELSPRAQQERLDELSRLRSYHPTHKHNRGYGAVGLSLPHGCRVYYAELLAFYGIPTAPPNSTSPNSLTTQVGWCLEVIGSRHLRPSPLSLSTGESLAELVLEPNPRKSAAAKRREASRQARTGSHKRLYGNFTGEAPPMRAWRALPSNLSKYTQADVDWAANNSLLDLATEAVSLNPALQLPASAAPKPATSSASQDPDGQPRALPKQELHEPEPALDHPPMPSPGGKPTTQSTPVYLYKGRNITEPVLDAYEQHYTNQISFPKLQGLADEWQLPLYVIRRLATQEHVRRTMDGYEPQPEQPNR